jgi:preprotein translocase subunit YajC
MSFFISDAMAQAGGPGGEPNLFISILPLVFIFAIFYFLMIRPQSKRAKEHKQLVESLKKGDEVVTGGGMLGRITEVGENFVQLEVADGIQLRVQKHAVGSLMPKGTVKGDL